MSKVYADKKLEYGKIKEFEKPTELANDPIYADQNMDKYFRDGDSTTVDEGNGDDIDYINPPMPDNIVVEKVGIESQIPIKDGDTSSKAKKPDEKKDNKLPTPGIKPPEDKTKKIVKPKPANDY